MAVPAGLLPVAVAADDGSLRFVVPWRTIGLLVVASRPWPAPWRCGRVGRAAAAAGPAVHRPLRVTR